MNKPLLFSIDPSNSKINDNIRSVVTGLTTGLTKEEYKRNSRRLDGIDVISHRMKLAYNYLSGISLDFVLKYKYSIVVEEASLET